MSFEAEKNKFCTNHQHVHSNTCPVLVTLSHQAILGYSYTLCSLSHTYTTICTAVTSAQKNTLSGIEIIVEHSKITLQQRGLTCPSGWHQYFQHCYADKIMLKNQSCREVGGYDMKSRMPRLYTQIISPISYEYTNGRHHVFDGDYFMSRPLFDVFNGMRLCYVPAYVGRNNTCPDGFYQCSSDKTCIVVKSVCDGIVDCEDGEDEENCSHICTKPHPHTQCTQCNIAQGCHCTALHFHCATVGCRPAAAVCDGVITCSDAADELLCQTSFDACIATSNLHHSENHKVTVQAATQWFTNRCTYSKTHVTQYDGSHLLHCTDWYCNRMYKCYMTYCIPVHYLCDDICDCSLCDDEYHCRDEVYMSCPAMIKCKKDGKVFI